jgi:23S rRNA (cytosine1962-C5)-methyltransferase
MKKITIRKNRNNIWFHKNDIISKEGGPNAGDSVVVYDKEGKFVGSAIYNPNSHIALRIFSNDKEEMNENFIYKSIMKAYQYRTEIGFKETFRLIFSESDNLPGLIIDKYGEGFVIQINSLGMEIRRITSKKRTIIRQYS